MVEEFDRRRFMIGTSALMAAAAAAGLAEARQAAAAARAATPPGPSARVAPVSETFFGETVTDPYRWMETPTDPDWEPFMRGSADHARALLDAIPGRDGLERRIGELTGGFDIVTGVQRSGSRLFFTRRKAGRQTPALVVRDGTAERILVDPESMQQDGAHVSLDWWRASPDGAHVVYGLSAAGSENSTAHIMHVATGEILPERIDRAQYASPSWLPDGSGFFFNRLQGAPLGSIDYYADSVCWLHRLRTDPAQDLKVLARGHHPAVPVAPEEFPIVFAAPGSAHAVAVVIGGVRRENPLWTAPLAAVLAGNPDWQPVCTVADQVTGSDLVGDDLYLLTTKNAENGRVLRTNAARPSLATAVEVVPEAPVGIEQIAGARDALYVFDMDGGYTRLRRRAHGADAPVETVALPSDGSSGPMFASADQDGLLLDFTSWLQPMRIYALEGASGRMTDTGLMPAPPIDLSPFEAIRTEATARDGTRVPLSIIRRKDAPKDGSSPTLVQAYGAYQISSSPGFWTRGIAFLEAGGTLATAHVRGGGEYGRRWWKGGQKLTKPNTWRDAIDCCEYLVREGYTSPGKLALSGTSAGGIMAGRALTERPDLFCAVIPRVGVLNALRAEFSQNGPPNIAEFGTVTTEDGFRGLKEMDALHHVRDGTRYPAVLLTHGMTDPRVEPWHSAKMAARLRAASPEGGPFALRVTFDAGHGLGSTRAQADTEWADIFAFVLWRAGMG